MAAKPSPLKSEEPVETEIDPCGQGASTEKKLTHGYYIWAGNAQKKEHLKAAA